MGTQPPHHKGGGAPSPIFGPFLLWPNDWMHQDATWYDGRSRPGQHYVKCGPSFPPKGHSPLISAHVCFGQTAECIKMPLGLSVLSCLPVTLVYCGQTVRWIKIKLGMQVGLGLGPGHTIRWGPKQNIVLVWLHQYACVSDSDAAHLTGRVMGTQL